MDRYPHLKEDLFVHLRYHFLVQAIPDMLIGSEIGVADTFAIIIFGVTKKWFQRTRCVFYKYFLPFIIAFTFYSFCSIGVRRVAFALAAMPCQTAG